MESLTTILLVLGVIAVVASWFVAVRVIKSDEAVTAVQPLGSETHPGNTRTDALAGIRAH